MHCFGCFSFRVVKIFCWTIAFFVAKFALLLQALTRPQLVVHRLLNTQEHVLHFGQFLWAWRRGLYVEECISRLVCKYLQLIEQSPIMVEPKGGFPIPWWKLYDNHAVVQTYWLCLRSRYFNMEMWYLIQTLKRWHLIGRSTIAFKSRTEVAFILNILVSTPL